MIKKIILAAGVTVMLASCAGIKTQSNNFISPNGATMQLALEQKVGDRVLFKLNSSSLSYEAKSVLDRQAEWLKENPHVNVILEGHTDDRGTGEYNLALGERRANTVRKYLTSNYDINSNSITVISYGKEKPAVIGNDHESWGLNRRVVTLVE